jgi:zinc transporter ZupT
MPFISSVDSALQTSLMAGIVIHNIPIAIVLVSFFLHSGVSKRNTFLLLAFFSIMTPVGGLCSNFFSDFFSFNIQTYTNTIMAFVVGIFLHVSTSILFEACENHKYNLVRFATVIFGVAVAFAVSTLSH